MKQREITRWTDLLDKKGALASPGFARKMLFNYNRENIRSRPFALKEWDFYQIQHGSYVAHLTIGHVTYAGNVAADIINMETGEKAGFNVLFPFPMRSMPMDRNPEKPHELHISKRDYDACYTVTDTARRLTMHSTGGKYGAVDIDITLNNNPDNEKMVIATPFHGNPNQFYLNYKENYWGGSGSMTLGDMSLDLDDSTVALIDWGRGVWPFTQEWFWGNGTGWVNAEHFGFNIGWGFGDLSNATENFFFYKDKAYKLGTLKVDVDLTDYMKPWSFVSDDGDFNFTMTPMYDNYSETKLLFVDNHCHQVFGHWNGTATLPDGEKLEVHDLIAFCEHAKNRW